MNGEEFFNIINRCLDKGEDDFTSLNQVEKVCYLIGSMDSEFQMGGVMSVYFNSLGGYITEIVECLEVIGLKNIAEGLEDINTAFKDGNPDKDIQFRRQEIDKNRDAIVRKMRLHERELDETNFMQALSDYLE